MKRRRIAQLACLGALFVGGALWLRHRIANSPAYIMGKAVQDPRFGKMNAQILALQQQVERAPNAIEKRQELAQLYEKLGLLDLAVDQYSHIVLIDPSNETAALSLANAQLATGNIDVAGRQFKEITERWPRNADGWYGKAIIAYNDERYEEAVQAMQHVLQIRPKDDDSRFTLACALQAYAQQFPTSDGYEPILVLAKRNFEMVLPRWHQPADVYARLGNVCTTMNDLKDAMVYYAKAEALTPDRPDVSAQLAAIYIAGNKRAEATQTVDMAIKRHPEYAPLYELRGRLLRSSGDPAVGPKLVEVYRTATRLAPRDAMYWERLGNAYVRVGNMQGARESLEKATELNPNKSAPFQQLAAVYTRLGDSKLASRAAMLAQKMVFNEQQQKQIEQLSSAQPLDMNLHVILGDRYKDIGEYSAASAKYRLVLKYEPTNKRALDGQAALKQLLAARSDLKKP